MANTMTHRNQILEEKINNYESRTRIDLRKVKLTEPDMDWVIREAIGTKQCSMLWLANNQLTSQAISLLASALQDNSTLEALSICQNGLADADVLHLARALSNNQSKLHRLALTSNDITDEGVQCLTEMLKTNRSLTQLWLGFNKITDRGLHSLADVLADQNHTLEVLSLSRNNLITDVCIEFVIEMLESNQMLRVVCLSNCSLSESGKKKLIEATKSFTEFHLEL